MTYIDSVVLTLTERIEGRIVSANAAVSTSNIPPCNRGTVWGAAKD